MTRRFTSYLCSTLLLAFLAVSVQAGPIHDAVTKGKLDSVKALLKKNPNLISSIDKDGATPLHFATAKGNKAMAQLLIDNKADVNAKKKDGVTPLHVAAALGMKDVAELLIAKKAYVNNTDKAGRTPLLVAQANNRKELIELLLANKAVTGKDTSAEVAAPSAEPAQQGVIQSTDPITLANELISLVAKEDFASAVKMFDANVKQLMPESKLRETWKMVISQAGPLRSYSVARVEKVQGYDRVTINCEFEKAKLDAQIAFDNARQVAGFFILNPAAVNK